MDLQQTPVHPAYFRDLPIGNDDETLVYVVRHGQTRWNAEGRWQGWLDSRLTEQGIHQARETGHLLEQVDFAAVFSSDSGRAFHTASLILENRAGGLTAEPVVALRERFYGGYEGLSTAEIEQRFPGSRYHPERGESRLDWRPPGGESLREVCSRIQTLLNRITSRHPGQRVLCVTHSGVVRCLDHLATREPLEDIWLRVPGNACIFVLRCNREGRIGIAHHFYDPRTCDTSQSLSLYP